MEYNTLGRRDTQLRTVAITWPLPLLQTCPFYRELHGHGDAMVRVTQPIRWDAWLNPFTEQTLLCTSAIFLDFPMLNFLTKSFKRLIPKYEAVTGWGWHKVVQVVFCTRVPNWEGEKELKFSPCSFCQVRTHGAASAQGMPLPLMCKTALSSQTEALYRRYDVGSDANRLSYPVINSVPDRWHKNRWVS